METTATLLRQKTAHTISDYAATIRTPTPFNKLPAVAHHRGDRDYTADERTIDYGDDKDPERDQKYAQHEQNSTAAKDRTHHLGLRGNNPHSDTIQQITGGGAPQR